MAITVVCSGCQSKYSLSDSLAGKRAKCKKCGSSFVVPAVEEELPELEPLPELQPIDAGDGLQPLSDFGDSSDLFGGTLSGGDSSGGLFDGTPGLASGSNPLGSPAPTPLGLARPVPMATPGASTGASVATAIFSTLITFSAAVITALLLMCAVNPTLSLFMVGLGVVASIGCVVLGVMRKPGIAWALCGVYGLVCVLGMTKAGFDIVSNARTFQKKLEEERQRREGTSPWHVPTVPVNPLPNGNSGNNVAGQSNHARPSNDGPGWTRADENNNASLEPQFDDWKVVSDPLPDWAKVGEGPPLSLTLYDPAHEAIRVPKPVGRAIGISHRVASQDTLEVWDLGERKKVGQLVGRNEFDRDYTISPDGKYIAGKLRRGGEEGLEVWSVEKQQKVASIDVPRERFSNLFFEFSSPTTLVTVTGNHQATEVRTWDATSGKELHSGAQSQDFGRNEHFTLSSGRTFLVQVSGDALIFWSLADAQVAGRVRMPRSSNCQGCAFSPDGNEFLIGYDANGKSHLVCCDMASHAIKNHIVFPDGQETPFRQRFGSTVRCGWLAGDEGWLIGKEVILRRDGTRKWQIPESMTVEGTGILYDAQQFLSELKHDQALVVELKTFPFEIMDRAVAAVEAGGTELDAQLPPISQPDWSKVEELTLQSGVGWNVAPDVRAGFRNGAGNKNISLGNDRVQGAIFSDPQHAQIVVVDVDNQSPEHQELSPTVRSRLVRYDLYTGKAAVQTKVPGGSQLFAVSPLGQKAVLAIGIDDSRLDVYSLGEVSEQVTAWRPYGDLPPGAPQHSPGLGKKWTRQTVTWAGFVDEDHLLTLSNTDGMLVLWKLPERQALYRIKTGSRGEAALSPGRKYVAFQSGDRVQFLVARTGEPAGELELPFEPAHPVEHENSLAFAPDGSRLACIVGDVGGPFLVAFDLRTGQSLAEVPSGHGGTRAQWVGTRQLLTHGGANSYSGINFLDLDKRAVIWRYNIFGGYKASSAPDDRIWLVADNRGSSERVLVAQPFQPSADTRNAQAALPNNPAPVFGPGSRVSIEMGSLGGSSDLSQRVKTQLTNYLKSRGVQVVEGAPLKITGSVSSGQSRTEQYQVTTFGRGMAGNNTFSHTYTEQILEAQLVGSDGKPLWQTKSSSNYSGGYFFSTSLPEGQTGQSYVQEREQNAHKSAIEGFFLNLRLPYMLYPQPKDPQGLPAISNTAISLMDISREAAVGTKSSVSNSSQLASAEMYAKLLDADQATWIQQWKWCAELNRPIIGLRWGIGVQVDQPSNRAKEELRPQLADPGSMRELERAAGPVGTALVQMLRTKQTEGKFGTFVGSTDKNLREIVILGFGERPQLAAAAKKAAVDVVLIIKIDAVASGRQKDASMQLQILDLGSTKKLWESESLLSSKVAEQRIKGKDLTASLVKGATEFIDGKLTLQSIDAITGPIALGRAEGGTLHRANQLASIAELMLYESRDLITRDVATTAYTKLLGNSADAGKLTGNDLASRQTTIKKYVTAWQNSNN